MYFLFSLSGFINALLGTLFGLFFIAKRKKNYASKYFAFFCFAVAMWSYPYIMWPLADTKQEALFYFRILHFGAIFASVAYFHFVSVWLGVNKKNRWVIYIGYFLSFFFSFFVFSPYFIKDMVPKFSMKFWAVPGFLYHFYLLFFFFYAFYSSWILLKSFFNERGEKRKQIKLILIGMILAYLGGATNYFLWYNINIPPYGNILVSAYVVLTAYAIAKHHLMNIKFVLRRSTIYFLSFSITIFLALLLRYLLSFVFSNFFSNYGFIKDSLILIFALYIYPFISDHSYRFANKYFFTSLYKPEEVISEVSDKLRTTLNINLIYKNIAESLMRVFKSGAFAIILYNNKKKEFDIVYNKNFLFYKNEKVKLNHKFQKYFANKGKTVFVNILKEDHYDDYKHCIDFLTENEVSLITPLNIKKKVLAYMLLGRKESGEMYNEDDVRVLDVVGSQAAVTIDNSLLYGEVSGFNIKLGKEVDKATRDLKKANLQLKKLDEAKSDFISIASHQLRTPLTVIKGYISMILEGSFGDLNKKVSEPLYRVYESNERLIALVEDLLSISRIESGRLQYNFEENSVKKVVDSVVEELINSANKKGLDLAYKFESKKDYKAKIDPAKLRQVIMNLIDNAVKYTFEAKKDKGRIKVFLREDKKNILFSVEDNGLGIGKEDMNNLFKKFSRGKGMFVVHTNGTGLGLYVAKEIIEAHSGKIWAESEGVNKGAKFCFKLPKA